ncbi:hypothetical protein BpHYR1_049399 [Brachionus plicatilis]|uniref:Uncharacterized protein n=1 Tax=Brachionus plicatilis TaxID=10195 RepID=A0A3M7REB8_BRAPC|nr:hypothetical protein BpHYR1_049399 [Brachionus plicatilis]
MSIQRELSYQEKWKTNDHNALIYSLKTLIEAENSDEIFLPMGDRFFILEKPLSNNQSYNSGEPLLPIEIYTYYAVKSNIRCFSCVENKISKTQNDKFHLNSCEQLIDIYSRYEDYSIMNFTCKEQNDEICDICKGKKLLTKYKRKILIQDVFYDVWIKCADRNIPLRNILNVNGISMFKETKSKNIQAIDHFPDEEIFKVSSAFIQNHKEKLEKMNGYRIVNQTQHILSISMAIFEAYLFKKKRLIEFYVFGNFGSIYVPKTAIH